MFKSLLLVLLFHAPFLLFAQQEETLDGITVLENRGKVYLKWVINEGNTCNGIRIWRAKDTLNFMNIGQISGICGSETEKTAYEFVDEQPYLNAFNYYTIEMGSLGFSKVVSVEVFDFSSGIIIRPQPAKDFLQLVFKNDFSQEHHLYIFNLQGDLIFDTKDNSDKFSVSTLGMPNGMYVYKIVNAETGRLDSGKISVEN